jgi:hypothetical protein
MNISVPLFLSVKGMHISVPLFLSVTILTFFFQFQGLHLGANSGGDSGRGM